MKQPVLPKYNYQPKAYDGPSREEVLSLRNELLSPALATYYREPLMLIEGSKQYLFDETGKRYLDGFAGAGLVSCGHGHPDITRAVDELSEGLVQATTLHLHPEIVRYAELLATKLPGELNRFYFVNSGSEGNDLALLMARLYTGNYDFIALRNAYHGCSLATMGLTAHSTLKHTTPHGFGIHHALNPDTYRGPFGKERDAVAEYVHEVKDLILHATPGRVAGFIAESIQGVGGAVVLPEGYLKGVYEVVREHGGVCIADEVQTGFGRSGTHYWGFETQGVVPDIVVFAKGAGNGVPLACVVSTSQIANCMTHHGHFNSFGGNPLCCRVGRAVLEIIDKEGLQKNCRMVGSHLKSRLESLMYRHSLIGCVRGIGLMLGVEFVQDRASKAPATATCAVVHERARELGLILGKGGFYDNILRITPPMCITREDADFIVEVLDYAIPNG